MNAGVSRQVLSKWASDVAGRKITGFDKTTTASGVLFCELLNSARPSSVDMGKVKSDAVAEHDYMGNYRALEAGLEKIGVPWKIDVQSLAKGNPGASLEMLHRIFSLVGDTSTHSAPARSGLSSLDPNSIGADGSRAAKRKVAPDGKPAGKRGKAASGAAGVAEDEVGAEAQQPPPPPPPNALELSLRSQLEEARAELAESRAESRELREELDFYVLKLEMIEDACVSLAPAEAAAKVQLLLSAEEDALAVM